MLKMIFLKCFCNNYFFLNIKEIIFIYFILIIDWKIVSVDYMVKRKWLRRVFSDCIVFFRKKEIEIDVKNVFLKMSF